MPHDVNELCPIWLFYSYAYPLLYRDSKSIHSVHTLKGLGRKPELINFTATGSTQSPIMCQLLQ